MNQEIQNPEVKDKHHKTDVFLNKTQTLAASKYVLRTNAVFINRDSNANSGSSSLQSSAKNFNDLAEQILHDRMRHRRKLLSAVALSVLMIVLLSTLWGQPENLFMGIFVLTSISFGVFFYFHQRQEMTNGMLDPSGHFSKHTS